MALREVVFVCVILCSAYSASKPDIENEIEQVIQFVENGTSKISLTTESKDFVLVLGKTGVGKTPFTKWMTMNNSLLRSELDDESELFLMKDVEGDNRTIGDSISKSATIYPELYETANSVFYDFPGFRDTRGPAYELGISYFLKRVVDQAERVKILILVSYDIVKPRSGNRDGLLIAMKDVVDFTKNTEKYFNSIALIVSQAPETTQKYGNDSKIINSIKKSITKIINENEGDAEKVAVINLMNAMINKIGLFRYADREGLYSEMPLLCKGKRLIERMIDNNLNFTRVAENDFGYSVSDKTKVFVRNVTNRIIETTLMSDVQNTINGIKIYYENEISTSIDIVVLADRISNVIQLLGELRQNDPLLFVKDLVEVSTMLDIDSHNNYNVIYHCKYIEFLTTVEAVPLTLPASFVYIVANATNSISQKYEDHIDQFSEDLFNNNLPRVIDNIFAEITTFYTQLEENTFDLDVIVDRFSRGVEVFDEVNATISKEFFEQLKRGVNKLDIGLPHDLIEEIELRVSQQIFLSKENKGNNNIPAIAVTKLNDIRDQIDDSKKWYDFLHTIYADLPTNKWSKNNTQAVINFCDTQKKLMNMNAIITTNVSNVHLERLSLKPPQGVQLNSFKLDALKRLLEVFDDLHITCEDGQKMFVRGAFIRTSDIIKHDCWSEATHIEVYALDSIIIDSSMDKTGQEAQLFFISPNWHIEGANQRILLNGKNGKNGRGYPYRAKDGNDSKGYTENGENGENGEPGGPGGNFFAVGRSFKNIDTLTIETNGGNGGDGQDGGNGSNGVNGEDPPKMERCRMSSSDCAKKMWGDKFHYEYKTLKVFKGSFDYPEEEVVLYVHGHRAKKPGKGGDGGKCGASGFAGNVEIVNVTNSLTAWKIIANNGGAGNPGIGGRAGSKSRNGQSYFFLVEYFGISTTSFNPIVVSNVNGNNGTDENTTGQKDPIKFKRLFNFIIDYKMFGLERLVDENYRILESRIREFQTDLNNNSKIKASQEILGFANELDDLESRYLKLGNKISMSPFIESLMNRISEFASSRKSTKEHKQVLAHIYTSALSKLYLSKNKIANNTVYDLIGFLKGIENDIIDLRQIDSAQAINNHRDAYKSSLDAKKSTAIHFINSELTPEINNVFQIIDSKIDKLLEEVVAKRNSTEREMRENQRIQRVLERNLQIRKMLAPLKVIGSVVSVLGPKGALVGAAMNTGATIMEQFIDDEQSATDVNKIEIFKPALNQINDLHQQLSFSRHEKFKAKVVELDELIKKYEEDDETMNSSDMISNRHKRTIQEPTNLPREEETNKASDIFSESERAELIRAFQSIEPKPQSNKQKIEYIELKPLKQKISEARDLLKETDPAKDIGSELDKITLDISSQLDEIDVSIKHIESQLKVQSDDSKLKKKAEKRKEFYNNAQAVLTGINTGIDLYNKFKRDKSKMNEIGAIISKQQQSINSLEDREKEVSDMAIPYIRRIHDDLRNFQAGNTVAEKLIQKWKLKSFFRDLRNSFSRLTRGFSMEEDVQSCILKIDEGIATLVDIYDRMESYEETNQLAEYIANVNAAPLTSLRVDDPELSKALIIAENRIKSNLIMEKYNLAIHSTKQHYFPMIATLLRDYELPKSLNTNDSDLVINESCNKIKQLQNKIKEGKAISTDYNDDLHTETSFDGKMHSIFYKWKYDEFKQQIGHLLNGRGVVIKADVLNGLNANAVKFNQIGIRFELQNSTRQNDFDAKFGQQYVNMTMFGNNYYRCHNRIYSISLDRNVELEFKYSEEKWVDPNETFKLIRDNSAFLSPYGTWFIKLLGENNLSKFQNEPMDIELFGEGSYIKHGKFSNNVCNDQLDKYYEFYKLTSA